MISHHCCRNHSSDSHEIKQRYNPTFVHQSIFQSQNPKEKYPRFSQTFYSTALDTQGYNIKTIHEKKHHNRIQQQFEKKANVIPSDYSHQRRLEDLYPKTGIRYSSKEKWYDHAKEDYLSRVRNCHFSETLKQRKVMQLASGPVFIDLDYQPRTKDPINKSSLHKDVNQNPQAHASEIQQLIKQTKTQQHMPATSENQHYQQAKSNEIIQNKDSNNNELKLDDQIANKDFHKNSITQNGKLSQTRTRKSKDQLKQSQSCSKAPKPVSKNPTFSLVRGNKIDNRLHRK